jgi:hypothetical protein
MMLKLLEREVTFLISSGKVPIVSLGCIFGGGD